MSRPALSLTIRGHVQGVGFRWWILRRARELGLAGWVRNRSDGAVEALAIGERAHELAAACRRGPPSARVEEVEEGPGVDDGSHRFEERT
jgi:acylphosphatase